MKLILPGVGSFDLDMKLLNNSVMRSTLENLVLEKQVPVLGICVGMQMMAKCSEEGILPGLGWLDASVRRFDSQNLNKNILLPHMGWNDVSPATNSALFAKLDTPRFYFLHSYYFDPGQNTQILATTQYDIEFASAAGNKHIFGVQFHPEKSHKWGTQLLDNFAQI
jgi:glutamine amidotransferase